MPNESEHHAGQPADLTPASAGPGYEVRDASVRGIATFAVGLFVALILTQFAMWWLLNTIAGRRGPEPSPTSPYAEAPQEAGFVPPAGKVTPEVALEITEQRRKLDAEEQATLGGYARAADNSKGGTGGVRIPIDRAIDLIVERGLPAPSGPGRTEVEINSHSGQAAPDAGDKPAKTGDGPGVNAPGVTGKGATK